MTDTNELGMILQRRLEEAEVINESGIDFSKEEYDELLTSIYKSPEVASLTRWVDSLHMPTANRHGAPLWSRDRYVTPNSIYSQFAVASDAVENDDIVGGWMDTTESFAFTSMKFDHDDSDMEDVWNQMAKMWDLDSRIREIWHDMSTYSQAVIGTYWGTKNFKIRGTTENGVKRKKTISGLNVPLGITVMDTMKIIPVGSFIFRNEKLLYVPNDDFEQAAIDAALIDPTTDPVIAQLMLRKYEPTDADRKQMATYGLNFRSSTGSFYLLNPDRVWRMTATRSDSRAFAPVKMKKIFELLDLKNNLRQRDRVTLLGATNFIVLIKKGTDAMPARKGEIEHLQGISRTLVKMPLLVGDHRLNVEIVSPSQEHILKPESYNLLDSRITATLYQLLTTGNPAAGTRTDTSLNLGRFIGKGLESKRNQIRRSLERNLFDQIADANGPFDEPGRLLFQPERIAFEFDSQFAALLLSVYQQGDLSRESLLTEFGFDQDDEARMKTREVQYDSTFNTINPNNQQRDAGSGDSANPQADNTNVDLRQAGRSQGGNRSGGGSQTPAANRGKSNG